MQNLFNNCILTNIFIVVHKHFSFANTSLSFDHISRHSHKAILVISASNAWYLGQVPDSWDTFYTRRMYNSRQPSSEARIVVTQVFYALRVLSRLCIPDYPALLVPM